MDLLYQLALTLVPHIGDVHAKILVDHFGSAASIFKAKTALLEKIEGIGTARARAISSFRDFSRAEAELRFVQQHRIRTLFLTDQDYPQRLLHCSDPPALLFYKGRANLNAPRSLAIVGTRNHTEYGRQFTETLVRDLSAYTPLILSGLAFGIDGLAHRAALANKLATVGIVGHGLDKLYPYLHAELARTMIRSNGGVLTEFFSGTGPDKHNFPLRNRIVAGMSDAVVVIETHTKGGSMITAKLADAYHRDVFAVPGRTTDRSSSGCNRLIQYSKAILLHDAQQLTQVMGWEDQSPGLQPQRTLFYDLSSDERVIVDLLRNDPVHIDKIHLHSGISSSAAAQALLNLELNNIVASLPGKQYKLL